MHSTSLQQHSGESRKPYLKVIFLWRLEPQDVKNINGRDNLVAVDRYIEYWLFNNCTRFQVVCYEIWSLPPTTSFFKPQKAKSHIWHTTRDDLQHNYDDFRGNSAETILAKFEKWRTNVLTPFYIRLKKPMYSSDLRRLENNNYTDTHQKSTCTDW